jgi:ribosomal protein S18 acetylase RimI-like enzyme
MIERLTPPGYARAREAIGRAFCDYNLMRYARPNVRRRGPAVTTLYGAILADCLRRGEAYATADYAAVAGWLPPGTGVPGFFEQARAGMLGLPWTFGLRGFRRLLAYDAVARRLHHDYAQGPHWYLAAIGVEPTRQGQGLGSALMRPLLERADQQRMPCWLDTHQQQNVRLYQRHGFEVCERVELPGHPIPVYGMLRAPR